MKHPDAPKFRTRMAKEILAGLVRRGGNVNAGACGVVTDEKHAEFGQTVYNVWFSRDPKYPQHYDDRFHGLLGRGSQSFWVVVVDLALGDLPSDDVRGDGQDALALLGAAHLDAPCVVLDDWWWLTEVHGVHPTQLLLPVKAL